MIGKNLSLAVLAKNMIPVIEAYEDHKAEIQCRRIGTTEWVDTPEPSWRFLEFEYQVKGTQNNHNYAPDPYEREAIRLLGQTIKPKSIIDPPKVQIINTVDLHGGGYYTPEFYKENYLFFNPEKKVWQTYHELITHEISKEDK